MLIQIGETALHLACMGGHAEIVRLLLQYGASRDIVTHVRLHCVRIWLCIRVT